MRSFEVLLFDLGSTLIYFQGDWLGVYSQASKEMIRYLRESGLELDEPTFFEEYNQRLQRYITERESNFIEYTSEYILRTLLDENGFSQVPDELVNSALKTMYSFSQKHWHIEEDAKPTLDKLQNDGYHLGIISNAADDIDVQTLVDNVGIRSYFDVVISSAGVGIRKPNPRIFNITLNTWGISSDRAAMVGDTLGADILGAQNAGIFAIWITRRADSPENKAHQDTIQPDATIGTLSELPDLLDELGA